jgi:hypothetical protein
VESRISLDDATELTRTGDIWLFRGESAADRAIQLTTNSPVNHVARLVAMKVWKVVGLAGLVGVAATGVVIARGERKRRAYTPEEVRDRLKTRVKEAANA